MTSVGKILDYKKREDEDYYSILGCKEDSTKISKNWPVLKPILKATACLFLWSCLGKQKVEQINTEYKIRALQYHPDKNEGNKEAELKFQQLKEAKEVLSDPQRRTNYDKWRSSGIAISYKQWLSMKDHVHQSMHWSSPKTKDRMLESGGNSGPSSLGAASTSPAHRRASEGGANLHWAGRGTGSPWGTDPPSSVVNKFRNYEI